MKKREYNFDLLRIIAMFAVITIHVSAIWVKAYTSKNIDIDGNVINSYASIFYNTVSRFAVPCFIMISGAFILDDSKNISCEFFYKKSFKTIGIPTAIFSIYYLLLRLFLGDNLTLVIKDMILGKPYYHMWYIFMLFGIYLMSPFVLLVKEQVGEKQFKKIAIVFLVLASISNWMNSNTRLEWGIDQSFCYLGYFMIGYVLRKNSRNQKNWKMLSIFSGFFLQFIISLVNFYFQIIREIPETELSFGIVSPLSPGIVISSILIFYGFSNLTVKENRYIVILSNVSFIIFLFHAGFVKIFEILMYKYQMFSITSFETIWAVPILTFVVFLLSLISAFLYHYLYEKLFRRNI